MKNVQAKESFSLEYASSGYHSNPNLAGIKHCNRIEQILARTTMQGDEAIMLDENKNIISVTQGNIYFIFGNRLLTPNFSKIFAKLLSVSEATSDSRLVPSTAAVKLSTMLVEIVWPIEA